MKSYIRHWARTVPYCTYSTVTYWRENGMKEHRLCFNSQSNKILNVLESRVVNNTHYVVNAAPTTGEYVNYYS